MEKTELGSMIKKARQKKGYTQEVLAEKADIGLMYYGEIERGVKMPSMNIFIKIIEALTFLLIIFCRTSFLPAKNMYLTNLQKNLKN